MVFIFILFLSCTQNVYQEKCADLNIKYTLFFSELDQGGTVREVIFRFSQQLFNVTGKTNDKLRKTAKNEILVSNALLFITIETNKKLLYYNNNSIYSLK